jgi:hypothetical protein
VRSSDAVQKLGAEVRCSASLRLSGSRNPKTLHFEAMGLFAAVSLAFCLNYFFNRVNSPHVAVNFLNRLSLNRINWRQAVVNFVNMSFFI